MACGDDGQLAAQRGLQLLLQNLCGGIDLLISVLDSGLQRLLFVLCALARLTLLHIAGADKGQGADDAAGLAGAAQRQGDGMLLRRTRGGNDLRAQVAQQIAAFVQYTDRVMVAAQNQEGNARLVQACN